MITRGDKGNGKRRSPFGLRGDAGIEAPTKGTQRDTMNISQAWEAALQASEFFPADDSFRHLRSLIQRDDVTAVRQAIKEQETIEKDSFKLKLLARIDALLED
jgi:hypothetical protein